METGDPAIGPGLDLTGGSPYPGVILLATPRSGSTWVQYLLNVGLDLEPDLTGGALLDYPGMAEHLAIMPENAFWHLRPRATKIHAHWIDERVTLRPPRETWIIRLTRLDRRAQALSLIRADRTGRVHAATEPEAAEIRAAWEAVEVTEPQIIERMREIAVWETKADLWAEGCQILHLHYEPLLLDPERHLRRICDTIGIAGWSMPETVPLVRLANVDVDLPRERSEK